MSDEYSSFEDASSPSRLEETQAVIRDGDADSFIASNQGAPGGRLPPLLNDVRTTVIGGTSTNASNNNTSILPPALPPILPIAPMSPSNGLDLSDNTAAPRTYPAMLVSESGGSMPKLSLKSNSNNSATLPAALKENSEGRVFMRNPLETQQCYNSDDDTGSISSRYSTSSEGAFDVPPLLSITEYTTDEVVKHTAKDFDASSVSTGPEEPTAAYCRVSSLVAVAVLMCFGAIAVGLLGFLPFYYVGMRANAETTEFLLSEAMKGVTSITQNGAQMLPAFVHIITFNYIKRQHTTASEVTLPDSPQDLMVSLLAVLTRFTPSIQFLRFVYPGGLYAEAMYGANYTDLTGAYNHEVSLTPRWGINDTTLELADPLQLKGFFDIAGEFVRPNGPMQQIAKPWQENSSTIRWLFDSINTSGAYFNYVLPFSVDGELGYCEAGLSSENIIAETYKLTPALRKHGRIVILDYYRKIVLQNSWNQPSIREEIGDNGEVTYVPLRINEIDDPVMMAGMAEVLSQGGFHKLMQNRSTTLVIFKYQGNEAYLNLSRLTDGYGLDIVLGASVVRADFEEAFITARTVVISVTVGVVVLAAIIAVLIAYFVVKPLKELVPELQRASALEITPDASEFADASSGGSGGSGGKHRRTFITEINDIQEAYRKLKESLKEMKSYVPQAVMFNPDDKADGDNTEEVVEVGSGAPRRDLRLNTKIFKEQINVFTKKTCTVVLMELRTNPDVTSIAHTVDTITEAVSHYSGCVEQIGLNNILISFGAHAPLPMHASKGCHFALDVYYNIPESVRKYLVCLVDSNEFMVGTCGARNRNARVVFGIGHMLELVKVLWDIGCHVAATPKTTTHLPDHQSIPIEYVALQGSKVPIVLCELRPVSPQSDVARMTADAIRYRAGFYLMRSGAYQHAMANFNAIEDKNNMQVQRLLGLCQQRYAAGDKSFYVRPTEDVYHFELREEASHASQDVEQHDGTRGGHNHSLKIKKPLADASTIKRNGFSGHHNEVSSSHLANHPAADHLVDSFHSNMATTGADAPLDIATNGSFSAPLFDVMTNSSSGSDDFAAGDPRNALEMEVPLVFRDMDNHEWSRSVKKISEGAFSVVYLGMSEDGVQVAIKCIPRRRRDIKEENIEAEMHMAAKLRHPNIVQYITCSVTATHLAIIMEYVPGGSLYAVIENFGQLNPTVVRRFTVDILNGLAYLHTGGIVHCDVKPHNMLLGIDGVCKLSDFGSTDEAADMARTAVDDIVLRGTALYMAPEVARGERSTPQSDVYSLGISLLEMLLGVLPWRWSATAPRGSTPESLQLLYRNDARFVQCLGRHEVEPDIPDSLDREVLGFVRACCQVDPNKRPSAQELLSFPFLL